MAHHVRVGEIHQHEIVLPASDGAGNPGRDLGRAHFGFFVVGGHVPRRGDQQPVLAVERPFAAAVEEIGDVGVLFRFRHAQLPPSGTADRLSQDVGHGLGRTEGAGYVETFVVGRHGGDAHVRHGPAGESVEVRLDEGANELAAAVGPVIEDNHRVAVRDHRVAVRDRRVAVRDCPSAVRDRRVAVRDRPAGTGPRRSDHGGRYEFVRFAPVVGCLDGFRRGAGAVPLSLGEEIVGPAHPFPPVVPVHGVVSSGHGGDAAHAEPFDGLLQGPEIRRRAAGRRIAAVQDRVHQDAVAAKSPPRGQFEQRQVVFLGAVDQSVRREAQQVQPAARSLKPFQDSVERRVLEEPAVVDGFVDPADFLPHHPPGAQVEVAYFRVAHDPGRQPHVFTRCAQRGMGIRPPQPVEAGRLRQQDGVGFATGSDAPAVQDDERDGRIHLGVRIRKISIRAPGTYQAISIRAPDAFRAKGLL